MTDESRRFRLGLFVICGICLVVGGVLTLTAGRIFQKTHPLYCYFQENIQGLEPGSPVKFRGVQVGQVETVNVMPTSRIASVADAPRSESLIEVRSNLYVRKISDQSGSLVDRGQINASIVREVNQGLRVRIAWKDLTGQKYLDLDYVDPQKSPPPDLPFQPPGTYIPTAVEKSFTDIQRDVAEMTSKLAQVDFKSMADDLKATLSSIRTKVEAFDAGDAGRKIGDAADAVTELAKSRKVDEALDHLNSTLIRIESAATHLDELLSRPTLETMVDDWSASAASMRRLTADLEKSIPRLTTSLDETLASARRAIDDAKLPDTTATARDAMADVGNAARQIGALREGARHALGDLGDAARSLAQLVRYLEENPNALLHGKREEDGR